MSERRVEVLAFDGCPNVELALERARVAVANTRVLAAVRLVRRMMERMSLSFPEYPELDGVKVPN